VKLNKRMSVLLVLAILTGLFGAVTPSKVIAQDPGPKLSVFELVTSPT
jgi:hypothetical protein